MFKIRDIFRLLILVLCGLALGVNVYLLNARNLMHNMLPMPFGYGAAVVLSGSMETTFSAGDLIIVEDTDEYAVRDIVVYQDRNSLVVHRIIEIDDEFVITQGDANNAPDEAIALSSIKGKVLFWMPGVGNFISFLKTPTGICLTIMLAIALVEIPHFLEIQKDNEEREKIIEEIIKLKKDLE